ncbi:hypothetical protein ACTXT7_016666 [Hymenolepis weldensis]
MRRVRMPRIKTRGESSQSNCYHEIGKKRKQKRSKQSHSWSVRAKCLKDKKTDCGSAISAIPRRGLSKDNLHWMLHVKKAYPVGFLSLSSTISDCKEHWESCKNVRCLTRKEMRSRQRCESD